MTSQTPGRAYEHVQRKLTEQERIALRESLASHGLLDEITLDQHNDILDGYNREDLCGELGIAKRYRTLEVDDPVHWIRHNQTARRNLTEAEMRELIVAMKTENPEASVRTIAEKLGTSKATVARTISKAGVSGETPVKGKDGKTYRQKLKAAPKQDKAVHAIERREQAGEPITREAIAAEAGVSRGTADTVLAAHKAKAKVEPVDITLSMSAQEKFDAKIRAFKKNFDYEVETAARKMQKQWAEESLQRYSERLTKLEKQLAYRQGVMKAPEYKTLMMCCHPDTAANIGDAKRNEAVRILTEYRLKLMAEKEDPFVSKHGLPSSVADLQRAREEVRAANSARSKAAHAARKQREKAE